MGGLDTASDLAKGPRSLIHANKERNLARYALALIKNHIPCLDTRLRGSRRRDELPFQGAWRYCCKMLSACKTQADRAEEARRCFRGGGQASILACRSLPLEDAFKSSRMAKQDAGKADDKPRGLHIARVLVILVVILVVKKSRLI